MKTNKQTNKQTPELNLKSAGISHVYSANCNFSQLPVESFHILKSLFGTDGLKVETEFWPDHGSTSTPSFPLQSASAFTFKAFRSHCSVLGAIFTPNCHLLTLYSNRVVEDVAHFLKFRIKLGVNTVKPSRVRLSALSCT